MRYIINKSVSIEKCLLLLWLPPDGNELFSRLSFYGYGSHLKKCWIKKGTDALLFFRTSVYWTSLWLSSFAHNHFFFYTYNQPIRIYCGCFSYLMNSVSNGYNSSELYSEREKLTWTKQYLVTLVRRHTLGVFFCNLCSWSVYVVLIWSHPQPTRTEFGYATASAWLPVALDRRKCVMWNFILFV